MKKFIIVLVTFYFSLLNCNSQETYYQHNVCRAVSQDGISWVKDSTFIIPQAAVPGVIIDTAGNVLLYYVHLSGPASTDSLMVVSSLDGQIFSNPVPVNISGSTVMNKIDPNVIMLSDEELRLFYMDADTTPSINMHSATSADGINFTEDAGIRYTDSTGIIEPDVDYLGGEWICYLTKGSQLIRTKSLDAMAFKLDTGFHWNSGGSSSTMQFSCGYYRTYLTGDTGIKSAVGMSYLVPETGIRILPGVNETISSPSATCLLTGQYVMYYDSYINNSTGLNHTTGNGGILLSNIPNPFHDNTLITVPKELYCKEFLLKIYNCEGKLVYVNQYSGNGNIIFSRNELEDGVYFYIIESANGISGKGRFIID
jgi:hypothetical protein